METSFWYANKIIANNGNANAIFANTGNCAKGVWSLSKHNNKYVVSIIIPKTNSVAARELAFKMFANLRLFFMVNCDVITIILSYKNNLQVVVVLKCYTKNRSITYWLKLNI